MVTDVISGHAPYQTRPLPECLTRALGVDTSDVFRGGVAAGFVYPDKLPRAAGRSQEMWERTDALFYSCERVSSPGGQVSSRRSSASRTDMTRHIPFPS